MGDISPTRRRQVKQWAGSQQGHDPEVKDKPRYTAVVEYGGGGSAGEGEMAEQPTVYWDLTQPDDESGAGLGGAGPRGKFKIKLQTIRQKEEMLRNGGNSWVAQGGPGTPEGSGSPSVSYQTRVVRRMSTETLSHGGGSIPTTTTTTYSEYSLPAHEFSIPPSSSTPSDATQSPHHTFTLTLNQSPSKPNLTLVLGSAIPVMKENIQALGAESLPVKCGALKGILAMIEQAWSMPTIGRDVAYRLCDVLRDDGGLDVLIENCGDEAGDREVALKSAEILAQSMTVDNRDFVAHKGLDVIVKMAARVRDDPQMTRATTGILESLFKHSQVTCSKLIKHGGLDTVLYSCRTTNTEILRHCAVALANLAIYGGEQNQQEMIEHKAHEWLFPLAFSNVDSIRYYAFLAIASLCTNKELEMDVVRSGTLGLIEPFLKSHDPALFGKSDYMHMHGQSKDWLKHLVPLLSSKREEAQSLAAFHFAMEAAILNERGEIEIFREIGAVEPLKRLASSTCKLAAKFSCLALELIGEELPQKLSPRVPLWTHQDIMLWLQQISVDGDTLQMFDSHKIDGDLLLLLNEENLRDDFNMKSGIARKKFMRELDRLKQTADYESHDPTRLDQWLGGVGGELGGEMRQYTYQMLRAGVDRKVLRQINEEHLEKDCYISNGVHRMRILEAARRMTSIATSPSSIGQGQELPLSERPLDAFISYRRSNGSQLASLLKVHLQLRGFSVFLDIEKLRAGKFDDNLLTSVRSARTFILVLTPNALDRCVGDQELKDWIHREVVAALEGGCNIIPIMDNFQFPVPESLPNDMRPICYFNSIRWIHDYQDACVDKLENFINGDLSVGGRHPPNPRHRSTLPPEPHGWGCEALDPPPQTSSSGNTEGNLSIEQSGNSVT